MITEIKSKAQESRYKLYRFLKDHFILEGVLSKYYSDIYVPANYIRKTNNLLDRLGFIKRFRYSKEGNRQLTYVARDDIHADIRIYYDCGFAKILVVEGLDFYTMPYHSDLCLKLGIERNSYIGRCGTNVDSCGIMVNPQNTSQHLNKNFIRLCDNLWFHEILKVYVTLKENIMYVAGSPQ